MEYRRIREGNTELDVPLVDETSQFPPITAPIFYNPAMELNRDATILLLSTLKPLNYLDAMGGTGVRGLRAAQECGIPVTINDHNVGAVDLIRRNVTALGLSCDVTWQDVNVMGSSRRFDAVDLDPFGTPAPYLDSLIRSAQRYLFITATDTAPLCGAHLKAGMRRYFSRPMNTEYNAEVALRTLLGFVAREIIKYDRGCEPLFCYTRSHYVRVHLRLISGIHAADRTLKRIGYLHQCTKCFERIEQPGLIAESPVCTSCGSPTKAIGPLWLGAINDRSHLIPMQFLLSRMELGTKRELHTLLSLCIDELDTSSHYDYHLMAQAIGRSPPKLERVVDRLRTAGYPSTRTHYSGTALKTMAPVDTLLQAIRDG